MSSTVQASIYLMATTNLKIDEYFLCFDGNLLEDGRREQGRAVVLISDTQLNFADSVFFPLILLLVGHKSLVYFYSFADSLPKMLPS
jgi:hypothetical protein